MRDGGLKISSDTAIEVLASMNDLPIACYTAVEAMKDQLILVASLDL